MKLPDSRNALVSLVSLAAVCVNVCLINWNKLIRGYLLGATPKDTPKGIAKVVASQRFACCPLHCYDQGPPWVSKIQIKFLL